MTEDAVGVEAGVSRRSGTSDSETNGPKFKGERSLRACPWAYVYGCGGLTGWAVCMMRRMCLMSETWDGKRTKEEYGLARSETGETSHSTMTMMTKITGSVGVGVGVVVWSWYGRGSSRINYMAKCEIWKRMPVVVL
ncbi:hypothetical protein F4859DRAFT_355623 [Xylaria cf. heliscus]|nr:hypothetical protein F4859DRAFT_355623 [Xylaria cf. heliscus]